MNGIQTRVYCCALTGFLVTCLTPAVAQDASDTQGSVEIEEIVVVEAPIERETVSRSRSPVVRTETILLSRQVSFTDLDLTKHADVMELRQRVEKTARESCTALENMFPLEETDSRYIQRCTRKAISSAEEDIQAAIAGAG